jgi:hypothetical protein
MSLRGASPTVSLALRWSERRLVREEIYYTVWFNTRFLKAVRCLNRGKPRGIKPDFRIKLQQITLKTQALNPEGKPKFRLMEHLAKNLPGLILAEQEFPVVDLGLDFVPHTLLEFSQLSHINNRGLTRRFASIGPGKNDKKQGKRVSTAKLYCRR